MEMVLISALIGAYVALLGLSVTLFLRLDRLERRLRDLGSKPTDAFREWLIDHPDSLPRFPTRDEKDG